MAESEGLEWYWILVIVLAVVLGLILLGYIYRLWISGRAYKKKNQIPGKVVVITGANTGIGKETAVELAARGAKVYMACRSVERGEAARKEVIERSGSQNVYLRQLDLGSLKSIRKFAQDFIADETRLDILINNAGIMACPQNLTEDGFESQLGTNHLGHFLLTTLLLDLIKRSAPARIIVLSSLAHLYGKVNKSDLMFKDKYDPWTVYCQSKLANVLFANELARRLKNDGVTVNSVHPGAINTELSRSLEDSYGKLARPYNKFIAPAFLKTPKQGAQTTLTVALDPDLEKVTGKYFDNSRPAKMNPLAADEELAKWLWVESEKLVNEGTN